MDDKDKKDLNSENQSNSADSQVSEDLKDTETAAEKAEKLLDGTSKDKDFSIKKEKYDELSEKAKLYEANMVLIDKLNKRPDVVEELLETQKKGSLEAQVSQLFEESKVRKQRELREAVTNAFDTWKDFGDAWKNEGLSEDVDRLVKRGISYGEAIRRSYLALHPEAIQAEAERIARGGLNEHGSFSINSSYSPKTFQTKNHQLSEGEKAQAKMRGISEEAYAGLLTKHEKYLKARGFGDPTLEIPLGENLGR